MYILKKVFDWIFLWEHILDLLTVPNTGKCAAMPRSLTPFVTHSILWSFWCGNSCWTEPAFAGSF